MKCNQLISPELNESDFESELLTTVNDDEPNDQIIPEYTLKDTVSVFDDNVVLRKSDILEDAKRSDNFFNRSDDP